MKNLKDQISHNLWDKIDRYIDYRYHNSIAKQVWDNVWWPLDQQFHITLRHPIFQITYQRTKVD